MDPRRRLTIAAMVAVLATGACISAEGVPRGGTLRVIIPVGGVSNITAGPALDPQTDYWFDSFELFRCCLGRTLLAHPGLPTQDGGSVLHPDLAAELPEVSRGGLTGTFRLQGGLRYGPPLDDVEIA